MKPEVYRSITLADYDQQCGICSSFPVVVIVTEDGAISGGEMCGACMFGEAECLDADAWAVGDWKGEDADYSHYFLEQPDTSEEDE